MAVKTDKTEHEVPETLGLLTPPAEGQVVFGGEGTALVLDKDVHEGQLIEEVYAHLGERDAFEVITTEDLDGVKTLHVLGDADLDGVKSVVAAHTPDEDYGLSEKDKEIRDLTARLKGGEDLAPAELNVLLRRLL